MSVGLLDHFNIRTRKLADTVRFYEEVLEFKNGDRPNFTFPGAWMYSEGKPVVHIWSIFRRRTSSRSPIPASFTMSPLPAAVLPA